MTTKQTESTPKKPKAPAKPRTKALSTLTPVLTVSTEEITKPVKKAAAKKTTAIKATVAKTTAKKVPAKKTAAKKATTAKTTTAKTVAKKAPAKSAAAKKAPAKQAVPKKAAITELPVVGPAAVVVTPLPLMPTSKNRDALVKVGLSVLMLLVVALSGLLFDVGTLYMRGQHLQQAADDAALAGVAKLPDAAAASLASMQALDAAGVHASDDTHITVLPDGDAMRITITDSSISTYVLRVFERQPNVARSAVISRRGSAAAPSRVP